MVSRPWNLTQGRNDVASDKNSKKCETFTSEVSHDSCAIADRQKWIQRVRKKWIVCFSTTAARVGG